MIAKKLDATPSLCQLHPHSVLLGKVVKRYLESDVEQSYYLYVPKRGGVNAPLLVSVHGISRNARGHARHFASLAETYGVVILAPRFDAHRYPAYQRLGLSGERPDFALHAMIAAVAELTGANSQKIYMFGYSGGGQFVHRYAMAYPRQVAAIAIGAAGWYTFPNTKLRFPRGIAPHPKLAELRFEETDFLRIPTCVLIGEKDTERDAALRKSSHLDKSQGENRLERGRNWIHAMRQAANDHGLDTRYQLITLPNVGHSFSRSVISGGITEQVFSWLFGARPLKC